MRSLGRASSRYGTRSSTERPLRRHRLELGRPARLPVGAVASGIRRATVSGRSPRGTGGPGRRGPTVRKRNRNGVDVGRRGRRDRARRARTTGAYQSVPSSDAVGPDRGAGVVEQRARPARRPRRHGRASRRRSTANRSGLPWSWTRRPRRSARAPGAAVADVGADRGPRVVHALAVGHERRGVGRQARARRGAGSGTGSSPPPPGATMLTSARVAPPARTSASSSLERRLDRHGRARPARRAARRSR